MDAEAIYHIKQAQNPMDEPDNFYSRIGTIIKEITDFSNYYIFPYNSDKDFAEYLYHSDQTANPPGIQSVSQSGTLIAKMLNSGTTLLMNSDQIKKGISAGTLQILGATPDSWLGIRSGK